MKFTEKGARVQESTKVKYISTYTMSQNNILNIKNSLLLVSYYQGTGTPAGSPVNPEALWEACVNRR